MAKTWATKCCSGTYKNNYQLCCGIKEIYKLKKIICSSVFKEITVNFVFGFPLIEGNLTLLNKRRNQQ